MIWIIAVQKVHNASRASIISSATTMEFCSASSRSSRTSTSMEKSTHASCTISNYDCDDAAAQGAKTQVFKCKAIQWHLQLPVPWSRNGLQSSIWAAREILECRVGSAGHDRLPLLRLSNTRRGHVDPGCLFVKLQSTLSMEMEAFDSGLNRTISDGSDQLSRWLAA
jgi:hypothetical protein